jgi:hypothetical protein
MFERHDSGGSIGQNYLWSQTGQFSSVRTDTIVISVAPAVRNMDGLRFVLSESFQTGSKSREQSLLRQILCATSD